MHNTLSNGPLLSLHNFILAVVTYEAPLIKQRTYRKYQQTLALLTSFPRIRHHIMLKNTLKSSLIGCFWSSVVRNSGKTDTQCKWMTAFPVWNMLHESSCVCEKFNKIGWVTMIMVLLPPCLTLFKIDAIRICPWWRFWSCFFSYDVERWCVCHSKSTSYETSKSFGSYIFDLFRINA